MNKLQRCVFVGHLWQSFKMQVKLLMGASFDVVSREVSGDLTGRMLESKGCKGKTMITKRVEKGERRNAFRW